MPMITKLSRMQKLLLVAGFLWHFERPSRNIPISSFPKYPRASIESIGQGKPCHCLFILLFVPSQVMWLFELRYGKTPPISTERKFTCTFRSRLGQVYFTAKIRNGTMCWQRINTDFDSTISSQVLRLIPNRKSFLLLTKVRNLTPNTFFSPPTSI